MVFVTRSRRYVFAWSSDSICRIFYIFGSLSIFTGPVKEEANTDDNKNHETGGDPNNGGEVDIINALVFNHVGNNVGIFVQQGFQGGFFRRNKVFVGNERILDNFITIRFLVVILRHCQTSAAPQSVQETKDPHGSARAK